MNADLRRRFVDRMVAHIAEFFPSRFQELGEQAVREWIEDGIQRASQYRIRSERDVCKFIDIMIVFGRNFDTDPQCPWAPPILKAEPTDPSMKTERLLESARQQAILRNRGFRG
jgi:hypothetical protein